MIDRKKETSKIQIKDVKEVLRDFFDVKNSPDDDESLMELFQEKSVGKFNELDKIEREYLIEDRYPGKSIIEESMTLLRDVNGITQLNQFFDCVSKEKDDFLDLREDLDSVLNFFEGAQKGIFKSACEVTDLYNANKNYINNEELMEKANKINQIIAMPQPFSSIHHLPELYDNFNKLHQDILEKEAEPIMKGIKEDLKHVLDELDSDELKHEFGETFQNRFLELENKLKNSRKISDIRGIHDESYLLSSKCTGKINEFKDKNIENGDGEKGQGWEPKPKRKDLNIRNISKSRITIKNLEDIDEFLESLKEKLEEELEEDTVINLKI